MRILASENITDPRTGEVLYLIGDPISEEGLSFLQKRGIVYVPCNIVTQPENVFSDEEASEWISKFL